MEPVKRKKLTYFLICAVALVWGIILYRIFFNGTGDDYQLQVTMPPKKAEPYDQFAPKPDTFRLALNYRDPFLQEAQQPVIVSDPILRSTVMPMPAPKPIVDWSAVRYNGYVINPVTKKTVSILSIKGVERMLAEGEAFDGLKLLKNKKDSVLVNWQNTQKYIKQ